jgi:hypothetical protein
MKLLEAKPSWIHNLFLKQHDIESIHVNFGNVLWVACSILPGSLSHEIHCIVISLLI